MAVLKHSAARVLEFDAVRDQLRGYSRSSLGQSRIGALEPSQEREWIEGQQLLTQEVRAYLRTGGRFEFSGLSDPGELLDIVRIEGAALELEQIRNLLMLADRAAQWRQVGLHPPVEMREGWPGVEELTRRLADLNPFLGYFKNKISPDGSLEDGASSELARLRREIEKQKRAIQETLRGYLRHLAEGGAVQDELITLRGERFVIPVKSEQKRRAPGVVHGASSSGQTVYVEPMETIEQNNELVRLLEDELEEVHRILVEMTRRIGEVSAELRRAAEVLGELELQFAKAGFAEDFDCTMPQFSEREVRLAGARHPLLERNLRMKGSRAVPMSLEMADRERQLIISGPNTGGKTVALKTMGLLALMAQAGIPVMAAAARLPVFDSVLADIGDYQSIEQNLSTFSAHVTNIDFISKHATARSLILLDELGSATDPEEGAALAVSIAEHFQQLGALSIISTHHTALKVYAAGHEGVVNASVGFDERTLQPTYQLRVGVPGASAGINIAQRLGLNPKIIAASRTRVSLQTQDVARFLDRLQEEVRQIEAERARIKERETEVARERQRLEKEGLVEQKKHLREMEQKLETLLKDFAYQAREAVGAVQERAAAQKLTKDAERRVARLRREFKEQFDATVVAHRTGSDVGDPHAKPREVKYVEVGDQVRLKSLGKLARVERKLEGDIFEVSAGSLKMRVPRSDIAEAVSSRPADDGSRLRPIEAARARGIHIRLASEDDPAPSEINVIGKTVDEATDEVDKFVDRAFLAGLARVRIVHGSGMGILRKALRSYLKSHPHVATVAEPPQQEGGAGATVVELRG